MEQTIELITGYKDSKGVVHKSVTFGKRPTVADIMQLDNDPRSQISTQYGDMIMAQTITAFGGLRMPLEPSILLSLDEIDREDIERGANNFLAETKPDRPDKFDPEQLDVIRLPRGFTIGDVCYPVVRFGNLLTGQDDAFADQLSLVGLSRECFKFGKQIARIETEDGAAFIDGPIGIDEFRALDGTEVNVLRIGARFWKASFRLRGGKPIDDQDGSSSGGSGAQPGTAADDDQTKTSGEVGDQDGDRAGKALQPGPGDGAGLADTEAGSVSGDAE